MSGGKKTEKILRLEGVIAQLESQINNLKGSNSVLEAWRAAWLHGLPEGQQINLQTTIGALTQLWQKLRVEHQTAAVMRVEDLLNVERAHKLHQSNDLQHRQEVTKLTEDIRVYKLALQQAETQRDQNHQAHYNQGFDLANTKARVEELEKAIRDVLASFESGEILEAHPGNYDLDGLASVLGDDHAEI